MANTYTQIHLHVVFAVRFRRACIAGSWREELHKYISGIVTGQRHKLVAIYAMPDHVHMLIGLRPFQSLSELIQDVKAGSSKWINERRFCQGSFKWQEGFAAFAVYKPDMDIVVKYINNQEEHHRQIVFRDEYRKLLVEHEVEFEEKYLYSEPEDAVA